MGRAKENPDFLSNTQLNDILRDYDLDYHFSSFDGSPYLTLVSYQFGEIGIVDETLQRQWCWAANIVSKVDYIAESLGVSRFIVETKLTLVLEYLSENF